MRGATEPTRQAAERRIEHEVRDRIEARPGGLPAPIVVGEASPCDAGAGRPAQRFGAGREAEVVKGELRFYAARFGTAAVRRFRAVATCKFGLKTALAAVAGRPRAASTYGRVVRACVAFDPDAASS